MPLSPVPGAVIPLTGSRAYRYQRRPRHKHQGIDLFAAKGTPVVAPAPGTIVQVGEGWRRGFAGYGSIVVLRTLERPTRWLLFSHLDRVDVEEGDRVPAGEVLGTVGTSAGTRTDPSREFETSRPHLHFEVSPRPYPQPSEKPRSDPVAWLMGRAKSGKAGAGALVLVAIGLLAWLR